MYKLRHYEPGRRRPLRHRRWGRPSPPRHLGATGTASSAPHWSGERAVIRSEWNGSAPPSSCRHKMRQDTQHVGTHRHTHGGIGHGARSVCWRVCGHGRLPRAREGSRTARTLFTRRCCASGRFPENASACRAWRTASSSTTCSNFNDSCRWPFHSFYRGAFDPRYLLPTFGAAVDTADTAATAAALFFSLSPLASHIAGCHASPLCLLVWL